MVEWFKIALKMVGILGIIVIVLTKQPQMTSRDLVKSEVSHDAIGPFAIIGYENLNYS